MGYNEKVGKPSRIFFKKSDKGYVIHKLLNISPLSMINKIGDVLDEQELDCWISDPDVDVIIK